MTTSWQHIDQHERQRLIRIAEKAASRTDTGMVDVYSILGREHEVETYGRYITEVELTPTMVKFYGKKGGIFTKVKRPRGLHR